SCYLRASQLDGFLGVPAVNMAIGCWVAKTFGKPWQHTLHHGRIHRCGRRVIQIHRKRHHIEFLTNELLQTPRYTDIADALGDGVNFTVACRALVASSSWRIL